MATVAQQAWAWSGTAVGLGLAVYALIGSRKAWHHHQNPVDLAMCIVAGLWVLHLIASTALELATGHLVAAKATVN